VNGCIKFGAIFFYYKQPLFDVVYNSSSFNLENPRLLLGQAVVNNIGACYAK
jgi:hypothetical protein